MNRRQFLKRVGIGSIALASVPAVPTLLNALARPAWAGGEERFFAVVALSKAATIGGVDHRIALSGAGTFEAEEDDPEDGEVEGGGNFVHFDNAPAGTPKPIIGFGRWKARRFVSYQNTDASGNPFGTFGPIEASIIEMLVRLIPDSGPKINDVTLRVICNIGPAGATTGEAEGFRLTIPGAPFGPFEPLVPAAGLTHISRVDMFEQD